MHCNSIGICAEELSVCDFLDLSIDDFPLPNLTEFVNINPAESVASSSSSSSSSSAKSAEPQQPSSSADQVILPRNQWYYDQGRRRDATSRAASETAAAAASGSVNLMPDDASRAVHRRQKVALSNYYDSYIIISWSSFIAILIGIDLVWFIHRMARTYSTTKTILYGIQPAKSIDVDHTNLNGCKPLRDTVKQLAIHRNAQDVFRPPML